MRQIILDTETTGLVPEEGHRVIEIGGIELIDRRFTGNNFHQYLNPERIIEAEALAVHGISSEFLADKPLFADIMQQFINYINGAELVIHNAPFDVGFLNYEFKLTDPKAKPVTEYSAVFDTLTFARKKHPGKKNSLDALIKRYHIDGSSRDLHGALLDARLLAEVYLAMTGGQMSMFGDATAASTKTQHSQAVRPITGDREPLTVINAVAAELESHQARLAAIKQAADGSCLWDES